MALSYLRNVWNAVRARPSDPQDLRFPFIGRSIAGVRVTQENAMQVSAVWACMDVISSALASSDWNVYEGTRHADKKTELPDDSLQYVLNCRFNSEMTAQSGKRATALAAVGFGNGIAEIERDMANRIIGLWPIEPKRFELRRDIETWQLFYRVYQARTGGFVDLEPWQVLHIRGAGLTGFAGDDAIARAVQSIANAIAIDQFGAAYFANGTQMGVVLEYPGVGKMDQPTYERLKESWEERNQGVRKSFRVGFMDGGMKLHQMQVDAEKAQMIEAKHLSVEEICRWFRVPPHKVAHLLRATNNNIEHQGLEFSRDTLRPWKVEIEQECDYKLIAERGPKKFIEIDVDWAEQGDYKSRAEAYGILRGMGVFTANDVLRKLGENTISKAEGGDIRSVNGAAVRLEDVGKNMTPAAPKPAPSEPDDEPEEDTEVIEAWVRSVYARIASMVQNRRKEYAKKADGDARAREDAIAYMKGPLAELKPALAQWIGAMAEAGKRAEQVVDGREPADAASELISVVCGKRLAPAHGGGEEIRALTEQVAALASKDTKIDVHVAPAAVHVDGPTINVGAANVTVPEREVHVNVAGANVTVEPAAVQVDAPVSVSVPEREVNVSVAPAQVEVNAPVSVPERSVNVQVDAPHVDVAAPVVNVPERAVNIAPALVTVNTPETHVHVDGLGDGMKAVVDTLNRPMQPVRNRSGRVVGARRVDKLEDK